MDQDSLPVFVLGCVRCGKTVGGSEKTCPRCGASFDEMKFECPFCGELVALSDTRCGSCETEFALFAEEVSDATSVELDGPSQMDTPEGTEEEGQAPAEKCPKCGNAIPEDADACPTCQDAGDEFECPACGGKVGADDKMCPGCGARFE